MPTLPTNFSALLQTSSLEVRQHMHTLLTQSILDSLKEEKLAAKIDRLDDKKKKKKKKKEKKRYHLSLFFFLSYIQHRNSIAKKDNNNKLKK